MKKFYAVKMAIATAVISVACVGSANAVINLDAGTGTTTYATEITGQVVFSQDMEVKVGSVYTPAALPVVKLSCTSKFDTGEATLLNLKTGSTGNLAGVPPLAAITKFSGGAGSNDIIFKPVFGVQNIATDLFYFGQAIAGPAVLTDDVKLAPSSGSSVSCTYSVFESEAHWGQNNATKSVTASVLSWAPGLLNRAADNTCYSAAGCSGAGYGIIDLTTGGTKFTNNSLKGVAASINLNTRLAVVPGDSDDVRDKLGAALGFTNMVDNTTADTNVVVSGDFTTATKVWFETNAGNCGNYTPAAAGVLDATKTSAKFSKTQIAGWGTQQLATNGVAAGMNICMETDGVKVMEPSDYSAVVNLKVGAGSFTLPLSTDIGKVGRIRDNGSTDIVNLVLTPGGSYPGYIRINHTGAEAGDIAITLYNDNGMKVIVKLGDIPGQTTSTLGAQASTGQITVADLYTAAQAVDPTFLVSGGKLRIKVKSTATGDTLNASVYSTSKDGNSFVLIQE